MKVPRGYTRGPCWAAHCSGMVAWPPNTETSPVECDDTVRGPHRGIASPATPNPAKKAT